MDKSGTTTKVVQSVSVCVCVLTMRHHTYTRAKKHFWALGFRKKKLKRRRKKSEKVANELVEEKEVREAEQWQNCLFDDESEENRSKIQTPRKQFTMCDIDHNFFFFQTNCVNSC